MSDLTFNILKITTAIVMIVVARYVVPAIKSYVERCKNDSVYSLIETAVKAAEQTITGNGLGPVKKAQVKEKVLEWLAEKKINITEDQLDQLIEEAVYTMKNA